MAVRYQWADAARMPVSAEVAGETLEVIRRNNGGHLRPCDVVEDSRPANAPLHPCFTWDDSEAAELYRQEEARKVIRSVRVIREETPERGPEVVYVHVHREGGGQGYLPTAQVLSDEQLRAEALADALALLNGIRKRFEHLTELSEVFQAIDRAAGGGAGNGAAKKRRKNRAG